ncbi:MAG TPA: ABC transporter permease [Streptosporangiaceae bacterium]|nr:ABC transporter permease [Streptosporangiaceae bacterium]
MTSLNYAVADSATMLRRNLRHMQRYPTLTAMILGIPVVFLLIFVYVFGGTLGAGLGHTTDSRAAYVSFVIPGILMLAVAGAAQATAVTVAMDMTTGIIARFRTMSIARASVLTGHVLSSMIQSLLGVGVIVGLAFLIGFRSGASPLAWLAVIGLLALTALALTWLTVAMGLAAKSVETASNTPMFLMLLPFLGSGFVPTSSLPAGLRWFAEYQPFTPATTAVRQLLLGGAVGDNAVIAIAWGAGVSLAAYLWARHVYNTRPLSVR